MAIERFLDKHGLNPERIPGEVCLGALLEEMQLGLAGKGCLPMIPSYLSLGGNPNPEEPCCVMDAGGTNLRTARAVFTPEGGCRLEDIQKVPMPGTQGEMSSETFYNTLAGFAAGTGAAERIGLCFSYNVLLDRSLDGILDSWCKEVQVPDAPGKPVGASLKRALGGACQHITVLNDSVAALLGAHACDREVTLGLILGTGINICYSEASGNIPKLPQDLQADSMIISTEIGEFDGFPKSSFDEAVFRNSDAPELAHAEKQCAGAYLGELIGLAWKAAAGEGLIPEAFSRPVTLPGISSYLEGTNEGLPYDDGAVKIAETIIHRGAKIAAILTAGSILKSGKPGEQRAMVIEGSQYWKLTGFKDFFDRELETILAPYGIGIRIAVVENSCLLGAALAAFACPM